MDWKENVVVLLLLILSLEKIIWKRESYFVFYVLELIKRMKENCVF